MLDPGTKAPTRAHETDAGLDIYSRDEMLVPANAFAVFHTGVHIELPPNTVGFLKSKSGLNVLHDITSDGVIDQGYSGEIVVKLYNHGTHDYWVRKGEKISQLVVLPVLYEPVEIVDTVSGGDRGTDGFGSTGK